MLPSVNQIFLLIFTYLQSAKRETSPLSLPFANSVMKTLPWISCQREPSPLSLPFANSITKTIPWISCQKYPFHSYWSSIHKVGLALYHRIHDSWTPLWETFMQRRCDTIFSRWKGGGTSDEYVHIHTKGGSVMAVVGQIFDFRNLYNSPTHPPPTQLKK